MYVAPQSVQNLDFWGDFGKGFKQGFKGTFQVAAQAAPVFSMVAGPEAGAVIKAANAGVQMWKLQNLDNGQLYLQSLETMPPQMQNLDFWGDFAKGFKTGFTEAAKVADAISPLAEQYAKSAYGKEYADAIHQATQTTSQIAKGLDNMALQQLQAQPTVQNLDFWGDFAKGFKTGFTEAAKVADAISPLAEQYAKSSYGKEYADAIHQATQTTSQIAKGLDSLGLQQLQAEPTLQSLDFWGDFNEGFKTGFQETVKVADLIAPLAQKYAKSADGKKYAAAINQALKTTGQIAEGLDSMSLQNMETAPQYQVLLI